MIGQPPAEMKDWKDVVEDLKIAIHNTKINLALFEAQFLEALKHSRGK